MCKFPKTFDLWRLTHPIQGDERIRSYVRIRGSASRRPALNDNRTVNYWSEGIKWVWWRSAYASMKHLSEQVLLCNPASFWDKSEHGEINHFSTAWQHFGLMWITHPLGQTSRSSRAVALARNGPFSPRSPAKSWDLMAENCILMVSKCAVKQ